MLVVARVCWKEQQQTTRSATASCSVYLRGGRRGGSQSRPLLCGASPGNKAGLRLCHMYAALSGDERHHCIALSIEQ